MKSKSFKSNVKVFEIINHAYIIEGCNKMLYGKLTMVKKDSLQIYTYLINLSLNFCTGGLFSLKHNYSRRKIKLHLKLQLKCPL